ncbi:hypothetical protein B0H11DRAFT_1029304 [Mycena galericulata]|nr:hypothetical protein B0H11DRAFT_1029304 [Mycena galericulata]
MAGTHRRYQDALHVPNPCASLLIMSSLYAAIYSPLLSAPATASLLLVAGLYSLRLVYRLLPPAAAARCLRPPPPPSAPPTALLSALAFCYWVSRGATQSLYNCKYSTVGCNIPDKN